MAEILENETVKMKRVLENLDIKGLKKTKKIVKRPNGKKFIGTNKRLMKRRKVV